MQELKVVGCGWLGFPLASHFVEKGFKVLGTTTSEDKLTQLEAAGIHAFQLSLPAVHNPEKALFKEAGVIIINIPPQTRSEGKDYHKSCIEAIAPYIKANHKIIYISATSVYPDLDQAIDENTAVDKHSDRAQALWQTEDFLRAKFNQQLTILRMGGLLGYDRIPGKYSAGKTIDTGRERVNYIHRDDAIKIIEAIIEQEKWGVTLNAVAPQHPQKATVYNKNALSYDFEKVKFNDVETALTNRFIDGSKLEELLDYSYLYPDPLHFYYTK